MKDWTGSSIQREALVVPCAYCHQPAGEVCVGYDGKPLEAFPAHTVRINAAAAAREQAS